MIEVVARCLDSCRVIVEIHDYYVLNEYNLGSFCAFYSFRCTYIIAVCSRPMAEIFYAYPASVLRICGFWKSTKRPVIRQIGLAYRRSVVRRSSNRIRRSGGSRKVRRRRVGEISFTHT